MRRYENVPCCLNNGRGLCCNRPNIASQCAATCASISPTPDCTCDAAEAEACAASLMPGNITAQLTLLAHPDEEEEEAPQPVRKLKKASKLQKSGAAVLAPH